MQSYITAPLVSIVIPVYNVEPYLRECIDSALGQSYGNIEIILVDDGSSDGSPAMCDEYAESNDNVCVIHQENRGLSVARNVGLDASRGEYISFVDSDDWLDPEMVARCVKLIEKYDADACGVKFCLAYADGHLITNKTFSTEPACYDTEEALSRYLFNTNLNVCVCGKIWRRSLWGQVSCPEGKLHEDQHTTYRLIAEARRVVYNPEPMYYYRQREGSIGHSKFSEHSYDLLEGIDAQYAFISNKYPNIEGSIGAACSFWYCVFVNMMLRSDYCDEDAANRCQRFVRLHLKDILVTPYFNTVRKAQLMLFSISLSLYSTFYKHYLTKKTGENSC